jgi:hypothetical protein
MVPGYPQLRRDDLRGVSDSPALYLDLPNLADHQCDAPGKKKKGTWDALQADLLRPMRACTMNRFS